jgi:outer membrane receptor protein involved in Fe transport
MAVATAVPDARGKRLPLGVVSSSASFLALALLALAFLVQPRVASAQLLYGSLSGTITDASGAVIPGAQVNAINSQTGVSSSTVTDSTGIYRFANLTPGAYNVTFDAKGFGKQQKTGVHVAANEIAELNAQLSVGAATQSVTVSAAPPILQTEKADVHTDISAQEIENLPIQGSQGGNPQEMLRVIPGSGLPDETNSLAGNPQRSINSNINGQSEQGINWRIDGVPDAYPWLPADTAYVPPPDAVAQMHTVTNAMDAEQGSAGGAAINIEVKSGTNHFHGGANENYTSQVLQARDYFLTNSALYHKNVNIQHYYGADVGGPIVRDRLFFFGDYERTTQRQQAGPDVRTLPTAAMATGDFTGLPGSPVIYDPDTGDATGANKTQISCNGVANVICPGRIDPAAAAVVSLLQTDIKAETSTASDQNNFSGSGTAYFNRDDSDIKIDYDPTQNTTFFGRYSFSKTLVFDPPLLGPAVGDATNGGQLGNAPGLVQNIGLGATHVFSPHLLLDWNFGFTRQRLGSTFDLTSAKGLNDLKIPGTNNAGATGDPSLYYGLPGFIFPTGAVAPNTTAIGPAVAALGNAQPANPFLFRDQQFVTDANLSWNHGKHSFRGGIEWNHSQMNHFQPQGGTFQEPRGSFEFNGFVTSELGTTPSWFNGWADFLLGLPSGTGKARALFNPTALRWSQWAWYLQDTWQLTPTITITPGLRWEYYPFGTSDNGKGLRVLDLNTGNVLLGGYGSTPINDHMDVGSGLFLPRLGVAWSVRPNTVLRAGYGMSADPYTWHVLRNAYPSVLLDTNVPGNTANYVPAASLTGLNATGLGSGSYSVPTGLTLAPLPDLTSGVIPLPTSAGTTTFANPYRRGYINSFNLMVQQQWGNTSVQAGYVGARAIRPVVNLNPNASLPGTGSAGGILSQRWGRNQTAGISEMTPFNNNYYDSLQTTVSERLKDGSSANFAWTWGKSISYADNEDLGGVAYPYPTYWYKNRGPANFDRAHNFEIYGVLKTPFGRGEPWLQTGPAGWVLGGWMIDPLVSFMTGMPFTVGSGGNLNANGSGQTADLVGHYHRLNGKPLRSPLVCGQGQTSCEFFDTTAFAAPLITSAATAHYGNTNRNEFRGPDYFSGHLSVVRNFPIREALTLSVRASAINLTNTPHFANPNSSCGSNATTPGPVAGSGQLCSTAGAGNNFGSISSGLQPGGYFGPDHGSRVIWLGANVTF